MQLTDREESSRANGIRITLFIGRPLNQSRLTRSDSSENSVTYLLDLARANVPNAREDLFSVLVGELRRCGVSVMQNERNGHTLGLSGVVNEVVLKLLRENAIESAENRRHLYSSANRAMRQVLVDHARKRDSCKRGGDRKREPWDTLLEGFVSENGCEFEDLHEALNQLNEESPRQREVVEHRFFSGASIQETAQMLGVSPATVERDWRLARIKLHAIIRKARKGGESVG
jgi:RNA polymerase sigma factor (TIGR02999 family)